MERTRTDALLEQSLTTNGWDRIEENGRVWFTKPGHVLLTAQGANCAVGRLTLIEAAASQLAQERLADAGWSFDAGQWTNGDDRVDTLADAGVYEYAAQRHAEPVS